MIKEEFEKLLESWELLKTSENPVCIYGTGNACERILEEFSKRGIKCSGIFASDSFVRDREFCGYKVKSLSELEGEYGSITVCCAFGSSLPEVMNRIKEISQSHRLVFPELPVAGDELFSKEAFLSRFDEARSIYDNLADNQSKLVYKNVVKFKITGDVSYLIPTFTNPINDFSEIISPSENEDYIDLGGYTGDTVLEFIDITKGKYNSISVFEPDKRSFRKCVRNLISYDNIKMINACAWSHDTELRFSNSAGRQSKISDKGDIIAARSVDSVTKENGCSIIKYDVEGAEKQAIYGSKANIIKNNPKLIISAYHRPYDLIDIPNQLFEITDKYRLYIRQRSYFPAWDTLIYAVRK